MVSHCFFLLPMRDTRAEVCPVPSHHGILMLSQDGSIAYVNHVFCDMLGFRPEELTGRSYAMLVSPEDRATAMTAFGTERLGNNLFSFKLRKNDGTPIAVNIHRSPLIDANGRTYGIVVTIMPSANDLLPIST